MWSVEDSPLSLVNWFTGELMKKPWELMKSLLASLLNNTRQKSMNGRTKSLKLLENCSWQTPNY